MYAILKTGARVEIDTTCLFDNQYNTVDGERIFDRDIKRIGDDIRSGLGKCKYCGAIVKRGEEEKHFREEEKKTCENCFWYSNRCVKREYGPEHIEKTVNEKGETVTTKTKTVIEKYEKYCSYSCGCTKDEHRKMGIKWFTPENTFFLKYPNGFNDCATDIERLKIRGFDVKEFGAVGAGYHWFNIEYPKKIGSYNLTALNHIGSDGNVVIDCFRIRNCRLWYDFKIENGEIFTNKYKMGWTQVKTMTGIPGAVIDKLMKICNFNREATNNEAV